MFSVFLICYTFPLLACLWINIVYFLIRLVEFLEILPWTGSKYFGVNSGVRHGTIMGGGYKYIENNCFPFFLTQKAFLAMLS